MSELTPPPAFLPTPLQGRPVTAQIEEGLAWMQQQPGPGQVLGASPRPGATATSWIALNARTRVLAPTELRNLRPQGGAVLVVWPDETLIELVSAGSSNLGPEVRLCVLEWGVTGWMSAWLRAHGAVDARYGTPFPGSVPAGSRLRLLPEQVEAALLAREELLRFVPDTASAAAVASEMFDALAGAGTSCDSTMVWAWCLSRGYPPERARLLRDTATTALAEARAPRDRTPAPTGRDRLRLDRHRAVQVHA
ncbi:hypothetical protein [Salinibacterium sp. ZJ454]|uniref:hypothetical protein n=1 Tax=Salinibacterium sp. ZJ454 TaxID=2708339 RepID=UPI001420F944|nr:hypothetical protein [Salinibacterium sp. ZJ454]